MELPMVDSDGVTINVAGDDELAVIAMVNAPNDWVWRAIIIVDVAPLEDAAVCSEVDVIMLLLAEPPAIRQWS